MAKGFGLDPAACAFLKGVIADGFGGVHRFFDVTLFEEIGSEFGAVRFVGVVSPDAGLEFESDRQWVVLNL